MSVAAIEATDNGLTDTVFVTFGATSSATGFRQVPVVALEAAAVFLAKTAGDLRVCSHAVCKSVRSAAGTRLLGFAAGETYLRNIPFALGNFRKRRC